MYLVSSSYLVTIVASKYYIGYCKRRIILMKKSCISFIMVLNFLLLSGCNNNTVTVKNGYYVLMTNVGFSPCVTISDDGFSIGDLLSSNINNRVSGTYAIDDNTLTMTTDDNKYIYVFQVDGDSLIFHKNDSSSLNVINDRFGDKIADNAIFYLLSD